MLGRLKIHPLLFAFLCASVIAVTVYLVDTILIVLYAFFGMGSIGSAPTPGEKFWNSIIIPLLYPVFPILGLIGAGYAVGHILKRNAWKIGALFGIAWTILLLGGSYASVAMQRMQGIHVSQFDNDTARILMIIATLIVSPAFGGALYGYYRGKKK